MKEYKLESLMYQSKAFAKKEHIIENSTKDIQDKLNELSAKGYRLVSTDAANFGHAFYIYLYFEKDI